MFSTKNRASQLAKAIRSFEMELLERRLLLSSVAGTPGGLSPSMIEQAYDLKNIVFSSGGKTVSANGAGETIAIVDAYGDPDIASDLETFDANFGIGNDNASGQFVLTVATPQGSVQTNAGWAGEESLDVEWAHAIAPEANILLVEAPQPTTPDLTAAVTWAEDQTGVVAVSMSWGNSPEFAGETAYDHIFTTPSGHGGVTFVAASGDDGAPNYPSTSANVLAVGGTTLTVDSSGDWEGESPWVDSGGGESPYEGTDKPDVAYDGDPDTGFLVYDSIPFEGETGWQVVGGTSAGTPQWSAIIALVDQGRSVRGLNSLDGATQTIPDIYALPSSDFNTITGQGLTGLGSPVGEEIISALVGGGITSVQTTVGTGGGSPTAASQLAFVGQPSSIVAGSAITPAMTVDVEDSSGDVVTTDDSDVTLSLASGSGTLLGTLTAAAVDGVATFSSVTLDQAGSFTLEATDGSLTGATSDSFDVTAPVASQLAFAQQPSNVTAGSAISPGVTVDVETLGGSVVTTDNSEVVLSIASGSGNLLGTLDAVAVNGVATFSNVSLDRAGSYTLAAFDGSLTSAVSSSFTVSGGAASQLAFVQQPNGAAAGGAISPAVTVEVEDQFGNLVESGSSNVTLTAAIGSGALLGTTTVATVNGVATFNNLSLTTAGTYLLSAADGGLSVADSIEFTVTPGASAMVVFAQQPGDTNAGSDISPGVTVDVEDADGNIVTSDDSDVTISLASGSGTLHGTQVLEVVNGVATFSNLSLDQAGSYTLEASDGSLSSVVSNSFNVAAGASSKLVFSQEPTDMVAGTAMSPSVTVEVVDQFGNVVSTDSSNVSLASSGPGTLFGTVGIGAVNGVATFSNLSFTTAGHYSLTATDAGLTSATSSGFTVSAAAASQLVITNQQLVAAQFGAVSLDTTLAVEDLFGNVVTSDDSNVAVDVDSGSPSMNVGVVDGIARVPGFSPSQPGTYQFTFTDGSFSATSTNTFQVLYIPWKFRDWFGSIGLPSPGGVATVQSDALPFVAKAPVASVISPAFVVAEPVASSNANADGVLQSLDSSSGTDNDLNDKNILDS
jgi:hypothetical protein